jgi:hypothetical protein
MRRHAGAGPPFRGRGRGPGLLIRGFLDENPDVAERLLRYGVDRMRAADYSDEEIRAHVEEMHGCGHFDDLDVDSILG